MITDSVIGSNKANDDDDDDGSSSSVDDGGGGDDADSAITYNTLPIALFTVLQTWLLQLLQHISVVEANRNKQQPIVCKVSELMDAHYSVVANVRVLHIICNNNN